MNDLLNTTAERSALVIGGSIAGLVAARVLTDHFDRVTIIERDQLPSGPEPRAGVPQARHVHVLLQKGQQILEEFFPGLQDKLAAAGAQRIDWLADCLWYIPGIWAPRFASDLVTRFCSRDLLEWTIRRRLAANPKVILMPERDVIGLVGDANNERLIGVRVRHRNTGEQAAERAEEIRADLIVDASGRESRAPQWLESMDYAAPQETRINSFLGYSSRFYRRPADAGADWKAVLVRALPPTSSRGAGIFPIEGDRWMVNLGSAQRDYPPTDEAGFLEFARSLPDPLIYHTIKDAEPVSPIYGYRRTENRLRYFERLPRIPENFSAWRRGLCVQSSLRAGDDCGRARRRRAGRMFARATSPRAEW
jgi:hypothetical protein